MLIRISLIIAILAALAVGALNFVKVTEKINKVVAERDDWHGKFTKTDEELTKTKGELDKTAKDLKQTKDTLELTTAERDTAKAEAEAQTKKATELADKLAKTTDERNEAQQKLQRYTSIGFTPEQVLAFGKQLKDSQDTLEVANEEKKILTRKVATLQVRLDKLTKDDYHGPPLPAGLKGKILVVDPKWEFVMLDVGETQGVLQDGELLVNRNGKLIAKVRVSSVQKDRCIANVIPGWKLGDLIEGDQVIAAYPAS